MQRPPTTKNDTWLELQRILEAVRRGEQTVPLLTTRHAVGDVEFRLAPAQLLDLISALPDYVEIVPGEGPTWIKFVVDSEVSELVLYRALGDEQFYILGPVTTLH